MPITVNVAGQVGQIRLPTSKALWPLFETVINSIQSLEESDTKKKVIVIDALRPEHTQLKTGEQGRTAFCGAQRQLVRWPTAAVRR